MCLSLGSEAFWGAMALFAALALSTGLNVRRFLAAVRGASSEQGWIDAMSQEGPRLFVNGIWLLIAFFAARACGVFG